MLIATASTNGTLVYETQLPPMEGKNRIRQSFPSGYKITAAVLVQPVATE